MRAQENLSTDCSTSYWSSATQVMGWWRALGADSAAGVDGHLAFLAFRPYLKIRPRRSPKRQGWRRALRAAASSVGARTGFPDLDDFEGDDKMPKVR